MTLSACSWAVSLLRKFKIVLLACAAHEARGWGKETEISGVCSTSVLQLRHSFGASFSEEAAGNPESEVNASTFEGKKLCNVDLDALNEYGAFDVLPAEKILHGEDESKLLPCVLADSSTTWIHLHIPKAAGASLLFNLMVDALPPGDSLYTSQDCFPTIMETASDISGRKRFLAMFREPRAHLQSLYLECTESEFGQGRLKRCGTSGAAFTNLSTWLHWFADSGFANGAPCDLYNPYNFQAQRFSCSGQGLGLNAKDGKLQVPEILNRMNGLDFVGIADYYQESVCLFAAKSWAQLPAYCNCEDTVSWATFPQAPQEVSEHGIANHSVDDLSADELQLIDAFTLEDVLLFNAAVDRFLRDIRTAEQIHGVRILCKRDITVDK